MLSGLLLTRAWRVRGRGRDFEKRSAKEMLTKLEGLVLPELEGLVLRRRAIAEPMGLAEPMEFVEPLGMHQS